MGKAGSAASTGGENGQVGGILLGHEVCKKRMRSRKKGRLPQLTLGVGPWLEDKEKALPGNANPRTGKGQPEL